MSHSIRPAWKRYAFAFLMVGLAVFIRKSLDPILEHQSPLLFMVIATTLAAWYGGLGPGLIATGLGTFLGIVLFVKPYEPVDFSNLQDATRFFVFLMSGIITSALCAQLHEAMEYVSRQKEVLRRSEARFRNVFNQQFQFMTLLSPTGTIMEVNELTLVYTGLERDDLIGHLIWDTPVFRDLPEMRRDWPERLRRAAQSDVPVRTEDRYRDPGGNLRYADATVTAVRDSKGAVDFFIVQGTDTTDKKKAAEMLASSEEHLRLATEATDLGTWDYNPVTRQLNWSDRSKALFGLPPEADISVENFMTGVHPEDIERAREAVQSALNPAGDGSYSIDYRITPYGSDTVRWLRSVGQAHFNNGRAERFVGTLQDITQSRHAFDELVKARDAAEIANRAKSDFLANISHELRTPMNAVVGLANILHNSDLPAQKQREFIKTLQLSAQSMMHLINDLLDIAKIEHDQMQLDKVPFNLAELVEEIISIMAVKAHEKGIELAVHYGPSVEAAFIGDPLRLRQVLLNLVSNAVKFTHAGLVTLEVDARDNSITGLCDVLMEVTDTGIGIPLDKQDTIFSKFSQADTSITRKYGGTGLGLSICKTLVEMMDGTIGVTSVPGHGSTFRVSLSLPRSGERPALPDQTRNEAVPATKPPAQPRQAIAANDSGAPRVLLVEDYKDNVLVASVLLEELGYAIDLAENGRIAIDKFQRGHYDLILMDVQMPELDGLEATRRIRAAERENGLEATPIIAMTAHSLPGDREKCINAGMDDYISKPFRQQELKEKTEAALKRVAAS